MPPLGGMFAQPAGLCAGTWRAGPAPLGDPPYIYASEVLELEKLEICARPGTMSVVGGFTRLVED